MKRCSSPERVAAVGLPARDEVEALLELDQQPRDFGGVVLEVGVDRDDDIAARLAESRRESGRLAEVAAQPDDANVLVALVQARQCGERSVDGAVVDEDGLPLIAGRVKCSLQLLVQECERALFVVQRNDDRDHGGGGGGAGGEVVTGMLTVVGSVVGVVGTVVGGGGGGEGGGVAVVACVVVLRVEAAVVVRAVVVRDVVLEVEGAVVCALVERVRLVGGCEGGGFEAGDERVASTATRAPAAASTRTAAARTGSGARGRRGGITAVGSVPAISVGAPLIVVSPVRSASTSALPSAGRAAGSFASAAIATAASAGGTSLRRSAGGGGGSLMCLRAISIAFSASNGSRPVSIR